MCLYNALALISCFLSIFVNLKEVEKKSYNIQFKLDAIKFAEENSNHSASRQFGVAVKRIRVERQ